ncbi:MAG: glycogen debranching protein GlgX [Candidatus Hydrogenedens sp.]|nr:glycogen debranching protein GlgX [Candidatus Hydrogenedens sp.]
MSMIDTEKLTVRRGRPYPPGCVVSIDGTRFCVVSRHATRVWLCLFAEAKDSHPLWEFEYDPVEHKLGDVWSILVEHVPPGTCYMYRMDGPFAPDKGHWFQHQAYLLDPHARAFAGDVHDGTLKSVTVPIDLDRHGVPAPRIPMGKSVIYEVHVRGFTRHESSGAEHPGTYKALAERAQYLKDLGVTAVELLPVQEMGEDRLGRCSIDGGAELTNFWGYSSIGFFAPMARYAASGEGWDHVEEFREMVDALHDAGIEVILDVVFNHTSEGNHLGPTLCFRGIDNAIYYLLDAEGNYMNYSGCGNTVNCNHPLVRDFILDCLRYWVSVMRVDGFRFDLASILSRDEEGRLMHDPPLIRRIAEDPVLRDTKLIAEAWDAGGAYQVGSFGVHRWAEWNGRYRDDVRRYWRGDPGTRADFATRLSGSADLYQHNGRTPHHGVNFVTCHDGFTLRDLVSYEHKHNWRNGEGNRDGGDHNFSFNCGVEGESNDPEIVALRLRLQKNFIATLFISLGVPMLLGGDEFSRTQQGNNNAYCQDNEISWFDWGMAEEYAGLLRFTRAMIQFRRDNPVFERETFFRGTAHTPEGEAYEDIRWLSPRGKSLDWGSPRTPMACWIHARENAGCHLYFAFNNTHTTVAFRLPERTWRIRVRTDLEMDFEPTGAFGWEAVTEQPLAVPPRTLMILDSLEDPTGTPERS